MEEYEIVDEDTAFGAGTAVMLGFAIMLTINESFIIYQESYGQTKQSKKDELIKYGKEDDDDQNEGLLIKPHDREGLTKVKADSELRSESSALLHTVALCLHSLTEGIAMGSALYCKYQFFS